jgi:hypothetical protein
MRKMKNAYRIVAEKREGKVLGGRRSDDNIKMFFKEMACKIWTEFLWFRTGLGGGLL